MHRTHNKEVTLRKKEEIENFKEKCDLLEKSGWVAKFHIDNWAKKGHQDSNGYWKEYPEYSIDEAYEICKTSLSLTVKEKDIVIGLLNDSLTRGFLSEDEHLLLKRLNRF